MGASLSTGTSPTTESIAPLNPGINPGKCEHPCQVEDLNPTGQIPPQGTHNQLIYDQFALWTNTAHATKSNTQYWIAFLLAKGIRWSPWTYMYSHTILKCTTPNLDITVGSKNPFTAGFWTDSGISTVMRGWHHYRFLKTDTDHQAIVSVPRSTRQCLVEQHCRFIVPTDSDGCFKSVGSWLKPTVLSKPTLSVHGSSRQCWSRQHCRLMA